MAESIVIVSAARTPIGGLLGDFASLAAWELGAVAVKAAVERAGVPGDAVDEVLLGNCLMAGQGQAPARQAMRRAGLPDSTGAVTLSKMCGSGMRAMMFGHDMLLAGSANVIVAGGIGPFDQQIRVVGEAAKPQALNYREKMSLIDLMISVGGLTDFAAGNKAYILRTVDGKQERLGVRLEDLLKGGDVSANVDMRPGDVLVVPESLF